MLRIWWATIRAASGDKVGRLCIASPRRFALLCFALCARLFVDTQRRSRTGLAISIGIQTKAGSAGQHGVGGSAYSMSQRLPSLAEPNVHPLRPSSEAALASPALSPIPLSWQLRMAVNRCGCGESRARAASGVPAFPFSFLAIFEVQLQRRAQHSTAIAKHSPKTQKCPNVSLHLPTPPLFQSGPIIKTAASSGDPNHSTHTDEAGSNTQACGTAFFYLPCRCSARASLRSAATKSCGA